MILGRCTFDGCNVLTIGARCVEHDVAVTRTFVRGRPFVPPTATAPPRSRSVAVVPHAQSERHERIGGRATSGSTLIST